MIYMHTLVLLNPRSPECSCRWPSVTSSSRDRGGRGGTMEALRQSILQAVRSSAVLVSSLSFFPVQSRTLSIEHFLCLPLFLDPSKVPWRIVFDSVWWRVTRPYHASFLLLMVARISSYLPTICWMVAFTCSLVFRSFQEIPSRRRRHFISKDLTLFSSSAVSVQLSHP